MIPFDGELLTGPLCQRLTWVLLHFCWQGLAVAALVAAWLRLFRPRRAETRYALCLIGLALMVAVPTATFVLIPTDAARPVAVAAVDCLPVEQPIEPVQAMSELPEAPVGDAVAVEVNELRAEPIDVPAEAEPAAVAPTLTQRLGAMLRAGQPYVLVAWTLGVLMLGTRLLVGYAGVQLLQWRREPLGEAMLARVAELSRRMGMGGRARVFASRMTTEAIAVGFFRPVVLVPAAWLLEISPEALEAVVAHELAHVRRWDLWANLLQRLIETLFFYHPAVWWLSRRIRLEREMCCDEAAVAATGRRIDYLRALEWVARKKVAPRGLLLSTSMTPRRTTLLSRVRYLVGLDSHTDKARWWPVGLAAVLLVAAVWGSMAGGAASQEAPDDQGVPRTSEAAAIDDKPTEESLTPEQREKYDEAIEVLRTFKLDQPREDEWAWAVRSLVELGSPVVPRLIEELERTDRNKTIRALAFTLRAIGDPRAVPALIRTLPRTLELQGSDCGLMIEDEDLAAFMQKHDLDKSEGTHFGFNRPMREVLGALARITKRRYSLHEICFVHPGGAPRQRAMQRRIYHREAQRWATWWEANWKKLLDDPAYSKVNLPPMAKSDLDLLAAPPDLSNRFPRGEGVKLNSGMQSTIGWPPRHLHKYDFDTGRGVRWPKKFPRATKLEPWHEPTVTEWARSEGIDLLGLEFRTKGEKRPHAIVKGVGLRAWRLESTHVPSNERVPSGPYSASPQSRSYESIEEILTSGEPLELGQPVGDVLMEFDPKSSDYEDEWSGTYLFVTSDGARGIMMLRARIGTRQLRNGKTERILDLGVRRRLIFQTAVDKSGKKAKEAAADDKDSSPDSVKPGSRSQAVGVGSDAGLEGTVAIDPTKMPSETATADPLDAILHKVRENEKLYENLDVTLQTIYEDRQEHHGDIGDSGGTISFVAHVDRDYTVHSVQQDGKFRMETTGSTQLADGKTRSEDELRVFDGKTTRVLRTGRPGRVIDGCEIRHPLVRPHMFFLRPMGQQSRVPLSTYLAGHEAMAAWPGVNWSPKLTLKNTYEGPDELQGMACEKVWITVVLANGEPHNRWELWLAKDRNYLPVRMLAYTFRFSDGTPVGEGTVTRWHEIKPGVWFPQEVHHQSFDKFKIQREGRQEPTWSEKYVIKDVSLDPKHGTSFFEELPFPDSTKIEEVDAEGHVRRSYVQQPDTNRKP